MKVKVYLSSNGLGSDERKSFIDDLMYEWLRYAGVVKYDASDNSMTIACPKDVGMQKTWAEMNAARIRSFGFAAHAVKG